MKMTPWTGFTFPVGEIWNRCVGKRQRAVEKRQGAFLRPFKISTHRAVSQQARKEQKNLVTQLDYEQLYTERDCIRSAGTKSFHPRK